MKSHVELFDNEGASVDAVVYYWMNKEPNAKIDKDGYAVHRGKPREVIIYFPSDTNNYTVTTKVVLHVDAIKKLYKEIERVESLREKLFVD